MRKITNFIVSKRYFILIFMIIISLFSLYIGTKVNINYDIKTYLPKTSETRKGLNIMENDFEEIKSSNLNVMFKDLKTKEKIKIKEELESIKGVESVDYDETSDYNKDNYTLYTLNVDDAVSSKKAKKVYDTVSKNYKNISLSGSIMEENKDTIKTWVLVFAVVCAMIILIIMCDSYVEPFLFLFTIGLGVFLNKGTNIFLPSVSNITSSISAVLQMALSMDYSIMLMNRYTQEKKNKNKIEAMKEALYNAFLSISSSSLTTIVGLLALVFMSFTIGRDLGFVLAKGVLFSLICIFTCLPGLIILFDDIITKTRKKAFNINLSSLGNFSYKMRYIMSILFVLIFIISIFLKGNLTILYTDTEIDDISKVFKEKNQLVMVYNKTYEKEVSDYIKTLKEDQNVTDILAYSNTINEPLKVSEVNSKLQELEIDTSIDEYLLKIIYYNYFNGDDDFSLSLNELINFINKDVKSSKEISKKIDNKSLNDLDKLKNFTTKNNVNKKRSKKELASILDIDSKTLDDLLILYSSKSVKTKITLTDFLNFLTSDVITNKKYSSKINKNDLEKINKLKLFTNKKLINKKMNSSELASTFSLEEESVKGIMLFYYLNNNTDTSLTINEFINIIYYLKNNTTYLDGYNLDNILSLYPLSLNENNINNTKMPKANLKYSFSSVSPDFVDKIYLYASLPDNTLFSPNEFIMFVLNNFNETLDNETINKLKLMSLVISNSKTKYDINGMSKLLGVENKSVRSIYALNDYINKKEWKLTPYQLVNFILKNKNREELKIIDKSNLELLTLLNKVMDSTNNDKKFSYKELASLLGLKEDDLKLLYSLYDYKRGIYKKVSLKDFIKFMINDVINNKEYSSYVDRNTKSKLVTIDKIIDGTLNNKKYKKSEIYNLLKEFNPKLDKKMIDLIYLYYGSKYLYDERSTITIEEMIKYLNDEIINDKKFKDFISHDLKMKIKDAKTLISDAKSLLLSDNYSRILINTTYPRESKETFTFVKQIEDDLKTNEKEIYLVGDSAMAYDISTTFDDEFNFITILTMAAIFIVVAISFKSVIIPIILVLIIESAVFLNMGILSLFSGRVYFIAIIIVQSILMGATIDYAIVYTSYYKEMRKKNDIRKSIIKAYNNSIHTIISSASVLIIVTLIVGNFANAIAAKICRTISQGTLCSAILIIFILPSLLSLFDRFICRDVYLSSRKKIK